MYSKEIIDEWKRVGIDLSLIQSVILERAEKQVINSGYRERRAGFMHSYTTQQWIDKLKKTKGLCPRCRRYTGINNLTLDHIVPIEKAPKGFVYTINYIQPLCLSCNSIKAQAEKNFTIRKMGRFLSHYTY